ncbi:MAG TPA: homoserine kinase [Acidimicrobiales bacterium]|nr:homoserine kinase [Acidimicrobiales bacterium]
MRARAPASSANLGPGFDVLAVALALYVEVEVVEADRLSVESSGHGAHLPVDAGHLAVEVASAVVGHDRLAIRVHSDIPLGRGLGSSAALAVATAAAAGGADPLATGARVDGHPENAAASAVGGLVAAATVDGVPVVRRLPLDPALRFVVAVPAVELATREARQALPATVPFADATFNLGRLGLLVAGLADHRLLGPAAFADRLHQTARTALFPASTAVLAAMVDAGALGACWSGAGPTMLGVATAAGAPAVAEAAAAALGADAAEVAVLEADHGGVTVSAG